MVCILMTHVLLVDISFDANRNDSWFDRSSIIVVATFDVSVEIYRCSTRGLRSWFWNRLMSALSRWQVVISTIFHAVWVTSWIEGFCICFGSSICAIGAIQLSDTYDFSKISVRLFKSGIWGLHFVGDICSCDFIFWLRINSFLLSSHSCTGCSINNLAMLVAWHRSRSIDLQSCLVCLNPSRMWDLDASSTTADSHCSLLVIELFFGLVSNSCALSQAH